MPSAARETASRRMTPAQAEWLALAGDNGGLPRDWPSGRAGRQSRRRVDLRIILGCLRQGWVLATPRLIITAAGRAALAAHGREQAMPVGRQPVLAEAHP
jgi:hypothetical protein